MESNKTREIGVARTHSKALVDDNWDLRFPQSTRVYAKMRREDAQVRSVINAVSLPIQRAEWWVDPNGADIEVVERVAQDLRLRILGDDLTRPMGRVFGHVSWKIHIEQVLKALVYGHMFFEKVYKVDDNGEEHLWKLAPRWPGTIQKIHVDKDGGLAGITQHGSDIKKKFGDEPQIPVGNLVAYVFDDEGGEWTGTSILRPAYKHWQLRDQLLRLELTILDRNGMGLPVYKGSEFAKNPDSDLAAGQKIVEAARSGESAGVSTPAGSDFKILGVSGQLVSPREAINYHDSMIARAVLAHFLNLQGGGSYALADTQADFFVQSLQTIAEWIADVATQHIIEGLVETAFPEYKGPRPRVIVDPIAAKKEFTPEQIAMLIDKGAIFADAVLDEHLRRVGGLPGKQPYADALREKKKKLELERKAGITLSQPPPQTSAVEDPPAEDAKDTGVAGETN